MADRYWVGGTASWDSTAGTKWATTSGGAGGASVPTSSDNVFFDANSGAVTVTKTGTEFCASCNFTGFTGTFAGTGTLNLYGSLTAVSGMTWTHTGTVFFSGSGAATLTSGGKTLGAVTINGGSAQSVTLQDALTSSGALTLTVGTFTTNNYNVTASSLTSSNTNTRTINLGSSTVTLSGASPIAFNTNTNLTFNAGTSTILMSATDVVVRGGSQGGTGVTFYNLSFTATTGTLHQLTARNTINNLSIAATATAGVRQFNFDDGQTINGTLSTTGTAGNRRVWLKGITYGVRQTLTINSAPSLTDADFRDIIVTGTAAPISGTRIGDLRGNSGITFDAPKTVYWNLAGGQNWSANGWAATSGGSPSVDNFPLAQDTAIIDNSSAGTMLNLDAALAYVGTISASTRTSAFTIQISTANTVYGDITLGSGITMSSSGAITFSGRDTQTITSAGKTFSNPITIDSYGGTVELADALNTAGNLTITNGTFDTKNYNVTASSLSSNNSNVRTINLGSSTITLAGNTTLTSSTNLTFNAGTSSIIHNATGSVFNGGGNVFYNVSFPSTSSFNSTQINGLNTFNNLTFTSSTTVGSIIPCIFSANQTINGTLTCSGATAVRRMFMRSDTLGTTRTLTVNSISADDCDFRDITIAGSAAGASPTRAGDCGGNSGINFPAPKTVYWNLSGIQNWSATAWATSSGGTPDVNNLPLAQDTAVVDNAGAASTISINASWNIGTFNSSARTNAVTFSIGNATTFYGDFLFGSGVTTSTGPSVVTFAKRGTQTITSNGRTFGHAITIDSFSGTVQLADALTIDSARTLTLTSGTFDAVTYNVTTGSLVATAGIAVTLRMGSGTWTISGTGNAWNVASDIRFFKNTADILLSDTSTTARTFVGAGLSYNKLTIGGTTGTSTTTISGNNQFIELASTKTVAHTIDLGTTTQTFGKWTVTGSAGNVVTLSGTGTSHVLAGSCTSGIDYLAMGSIGFAAASPAEFYAGANSTGTATAPVYRTATPAARTLYWVGGTGNWGDTAKWSTSSGGSGGASLPTTLDDVVFDSASNATAYTATVTGTTARCNSLTIAPPATGNITLAGTTTLFIHGNVTLPATGLITSYSGAITLSGSTTGKTFTTNGAALSSNITINGVGCGWTLGSSLSSTGTTLTVTNGSFDTAGYAVTATRITSSNRNSRTLSLGSSTVTLSGTSSFFTLTTDTNLTFNSDTSTINVSVINSNLDGGLGQTFYNVNFNYTSAETSGVSISGANTFNNLSIAGLATNSIKPVALSANQTINGTLTLSAGTNATCRTFVRSNTIGTTRTLTCNAVASLTDIDFRDIVIAGNAVSGGNLTGTRLGDCKGNSGITFDAPKTVYWAYPVSASWNTNTANGAWSDTIGGARSFAFFPLAQDTAVIPSTGLASGGQVTIDASYNIGTIDMSARTSNTMTLATGTTTPTIYGNWINGTGTTISGNTGPITFAGRSSQTITNAGKTFTQGITIDTPSGSVTLQDNFVSSADFNNAFRLTSGTFNANGYNVTLSGTGSSAINLSSTFTRTLAVGSGTWTLAGTGSTWNATTSTNLTVTGTGIISLTSASAKTFAGGGIPYSGITLDQGGAGALTITGNNTLANITNTYGSTGATTIALGTTTQRVANFTATGTVGKVLTITGNTSNLIYTGGSNITGLDYLNVQGRVYGSAGQMTDIWYAGANSVNSGSLGWIFADGVAPPVAANANFFLMFG